MRGIDTNILVRFLTVDDPAQSRTVEALMETVEAQDDRLHINSVTLCELAWVLRSRYRMSREKISSALESLLSVTILEIQDRDLVEKALHDFRAGSASFPDYLIGWNNQKAGCMETLTFDRTLASYPGFSLLS
ncbi:MAG TPA: type II toxin-antitoxin system VapC family toxin [Thermoanaerobaculia bacterium]|jgi:predicted nucleic-acid-binding protein